jgi:Flp pilus assembly protein TadD
MAKIYASTGNYDAAVDHAHRAGLLSPDNLAYRLQEATLYALLERWDELAGALNEVQRRFPVRSQSNASFRDLQLRLDASK